MRLPAPALVLLLAASSPAAADEPCAPGAPLAVDGLGTPTDDVARVGELAGAVALSPRVIRRGGAREEATCADGPALPYQPRAVPASVADGALEVLPLRLTSAFNSAYPSGANDGLLWAGRGASAMLTTGVAARWGVLSAALAPEIAWAANEAFTLRPTGLAGNGQFANPYYPTKIDLPQRFGDSAWRAWAPGQSYLRVDAWNVGAGISSENLWFGPGIRNAITMSNAGPGFPHVFLGTSRPQDVWIGTVEALLFYGRLERSPYMQGGTHPLISGLVLDYNPRWIPGLTVGVSRLMLQVWDRLRLRDWLSVFQTFAKDELVDDYGNAGGNNPRDNQLLSLFARWAFPESGFEVYGEWAREDHEWSFTDALVMPDHSEAWLIGIQKVFRAGPRWIRLHAEATHLQEIRPLAASRGTPVYYVHGNDLSYTNEGQLLGAWIGPGGSSQTLAVDVLGARGRLGGYVERVRRNDAYYWQTIEPTGRLADVEIATGLRGVLLARGVEVSIDAAHVYRFDRDFIGDVRDFRVELGVAVPLAAR